MRRHIRHKEKLSRLVQLHIGWKKSFLIWPRDSRTRSNSVFARGWGLVSAKEIGSSPQFCLNFKRTIAIVSMRRLWLHLCTLVHIRTKIIIFTLWWDSKFNCLRLVFIVVFELWMKLFLVMHMYSLYICIYIIQLQNVNRNTIKKDKYNKIFIFNSSLMIMQISLRIIISCNIICRMSRLNDTPRSHLI